MIAQRRDSKMWVLAVLLLVLSGCGWFKSSKSDNIQPPAELVEFTPTASVQELWSQSLKGGEERLGVRMGPTVADGRVYAVGTGGGIVALDPQSGHEIWRNDLQLPLSATPGAGDGLVVAGTLDGAVIVLSADSGNELWRAEVSSEVIARPAVARGVVVVRVNDGRVYGFNETTGERRWLYDRGLPTLTLRGNSPALIGLGTVYVGYDDGQVVALRLEDGVQLWQQAVAVPEGRSELERIVDVDGQLADSGSEIYAVSYHGQALALAPESGRPLWSREMSAYGGLALAGNSLLVADKEGTLWALDRRDGSALWKQDQLAHRWLSTPAVQGKYVAVGDMEGYLHWFDLDSGQLAARVRLGKDPIRATPVVAGDVLHAVTIDGKLGAYRVSGF